jgi:hypothetical protein
MCDLEAPWTLSCIDFTTVPWHKWHGGMGLATTLLYELRDPRHIQGNMKKLDIMHVFPTKKNSQKIT